MMNLRRSAARQAIRLVATVLPTFVLPIGALAQTNTGMIEGFARVADTDAPMPFSLVRLLRGDTLRTRSQEIIQQTITNADGRFRFASAPAGELRLQILRIGFHPMVSPVLRLGSGQDLRYDLLSEPLPVQLPVVAVHGTSGCLGAASLAEDSVLTMLWTEARKGIEIRRAFELRYRFTRSLQQVAQIRWRLRPDRKQVRVDTVVSEPDSVPAREQRLRSAHTAAGYGQGNSLIIPDEKELLNENFLEDNCLETTIQRGVNSVGVRFRPVNPRRAGYAIRGTVWLDSASYLIRRIDYEHLDNGEAFSQLAIDYAPVRVGASVLQLPATGKATLHPRGPAHWMASAVTATLAYMYWGFEEVSSK